MFHSAKQTVPVSSQTEIYEAARSGALAPRDRATVGAIIERSIEVSQSIASAQKQTFALADRAEDLIGRLTGAFPTAGSEASAQNKAHSAAAPTCAIELLFEAMDGLDPQVNALLSPLARISHALERLERVLG